VEHPFVFTLQRVNVSNAVPICNTSKIFTIDIICTTSNTILLVTMKDLKRVRKHNRCCFWMSGCYYIVPDIMPQTRTFWKALINLISRGFQTHTFLT